MGRGAGWGRGGGEEELGGVLCEEHQNYLWFWDHSVKGEESSRRGVRKFGWWDWQMSSVQIIEREHDRWHEKHETLETWFLPFLSS